jgi:hypothetical protein
MLLRLGLLVLSILLVVFLGWGAVSTWITVFREGPYTQIPTSGRGGGDRGEGPAIVGAITFTLFALASGAVAALAAASLARERRSRGVERR